MSGRNMSGDGISTRETTFKKSTKNGSWRSNEEAAERWGWGQAPVMWPPVPPLTPVEMRMGGSPSSGIRLRELPTGLPTGATGVWAAWGWRGRGGGCGVRCTEGYNIQWDVIIQTILRNTTMAETIGRTGSTSIKCNYILITEQVGFKYQQCSLK